MKVRSRIWRFERWLMCRLAILSIWFLSKFNSVKCLQFLKRPDGNHLSLFLAKSIFSKRWFPSKTSLPIDSKWFPFRLMVFTVLRCSNVWPVKSVSWLNSMLRRSKFFKPRKASEPINVNFEKPKLSSLRFSNFSKELPGITLAKLYLSLTSSTSSVPIPVNKLRPRLSFSRSVLFLKVSGDMICTFDLFGTDFHRVLFNN